MLWFVWAAWAPTLYNGSNEWLLAHNNPRLFGERKWFFKCYRRRSAVIIATQKNIVAGANESRIRIAVCVHRCWFSSVTAKMVFAQTKVAVVLLAFVGLCLSAEYMEEKGKFTNSNQFTWKRLTFCVLRERRKSIQCQAFIIQFDATTGKCVATPAEEQTCNLFDWNEIEISTDVLLCRIDL